MSVTMMDVRKVGMLVGQRHVPMKMAVRLVAIPVEIMRMLVVRVVDM